MTVSSLDGALDFLESLDTQAFRWELKKFRAMREWALQQAGIDYAVGDRVRIVDSFIVSSRNGDGSANGWWGYRECLVGGATGIVREIEFSPHKMNWYISFKPDREWSVHERNGAATRYWNGPVDDTPEGYEPPTPFDQDHYPDGRKHTFSLWAGYLKRVEGIFE